MYLSENHRKQEDLSVLRMVLSLPLVQFL